MNSINVWKSCQSGFFDNNKKTFLDEPSETSPLTLSNIGLMLSQMSEGKAASHSQTHTAWYASI